MNLESCLGLDDMLLHFLEEIYDLKEFFNVNIAVDGFHTVHYFLLDNCSQEVWDLHEYVIC